MVEGVGAGLAWPWSRWAGGIHLVSPLGVFGWSALFDRFVVGGAGQGELVDVGGGPVPTG